MPTLRSLPRNIHSHEHGAGVRPHWTSLYPAYCILPLVRSPLGYDMVRPFRTIVEGCVVAFSPYPLWWVYALVTQRKIPPDWGGQQYLLLLMAASVIAGLVTFGKRVRDERAGRAGPIIQSAEAGFSFLAQRTELPVPLCEIILMPALLGGLGWLLYSPDMFDVSVWLMICAVSYFRMAWWEYNRKWAQIRILNDDMARAQVFEERINTSRGTRPKASAAQDAPDVAAFGGGQRQAPPPQSPYPPAPEPDVAAWRPGSGGVNPDVMAFFRRRRQ